MLMSCTKNKQNKTLKLKHYSIYVDRKHLEEPFLPEQIISFVFIHYCLPISCKHQQAASFSSSILDLLN